MFKILTYPGGRTASDWCVLAVWHGKERVVFRGSVYACCYWVRDNS